MKFKVGDKITRYGEKETVMLIYPNFFDTTVKLHIDPTSGGYGKIIHHVRMRNTNLQPDLYFHNFQQIKSLLGIKDV